MSLGLRLNNIYKVVLVGSPKSGKTTFINKFLDVSTDDYNTTIAVEVHNIPFLISYKSDNLSVAHIKKEDIKAIQASIINSDQKDQPDEQPDEQPDDKRYILYLNVWDTGAGKYNGDISNYIARSAAIIVFFDLTNPTAYKNAICTASAYAEGNIILLVGTRYDLLSDQDKVSVINHIEKTSRYQFIPVSTVTNYNIQQPFDYLINHFTRYN
jgi:small GTP-binding protein